MEKILANLSSKAEEENEIFTPRFTLCSKSSCKIAEYKLDYVEPDDPERVEYFLRDHPNLIPEVRDYDFGRRRECIWPEDAKRILMRGKGSRHIEYTYDRVP